MDLLPQNAEFFPCGGVQEEVITEMAIIRMAIQAVCLDPMVGGVAAGVVVHMGVVGEIGALVRDRNQIMVLKNGVLETVRMDGVASRVPKFRIRPAGKLSLVAGVLVIQQMVVVVGAAVVGVAMVMVVTVVGVAVAGDKELVMPMVKQMPEILAGVEVRKVLHSPMLAVVGGQVVVVVVVVGDVMASCF